ncbi:hypothetical protein CTM97_04890 [Photobacterium phosphoreum]|uniref:Membrane transport protein MMPL domain-containing protein n=1 Tax=Photobacterium phosphoreum TaxID=659 RepID=A0A2T3JW94_PHOPO|nr:hypothetical protein CTM96_04050 [Photobacterium phosphoreum]PSU43351.1 hypothetical protein CTM97_04890 [Photobacterium phosphoreum]PSU53587.1 hypothetical protein C9J18_04040 [Photobacterium phosphoreum]
MFSNSNLSRLWLLIMLLLVAALGYQLTAHKQLPIETNILALLPQNDQDPAAQQAFDHITTSMSNKVVFLVGSPDRDTMITATEQFSHQLAKLGLFATIDAKMSHSQQQAWAQFYYPKRFQLLTPQQQQRLTHNPQQQTTQVLQALYNPFSGVTGAELEHDPFLLFRDYLTQLSTQSGHFSLDHGFLTTKYQQRHYALISAELAGSPYSVKLQHQLPALEKLQQQLINHYSTATEKVDILHTGVIFYAAHGTQSAEKEISTIGVGSLLGIIILLVVVYRSPLPLVLALLSISCGLIAAFVGTVAIFGKVHLFSLVFGASLIGVSIDYAFHYLTDRLAVGKDWDPHQGLRHIFVAISLGLITSLIGYLGMLVAPFPGLQQLSLFSAIGLTAAYATVVCWYPTLASKPCSPRPLPCRQLLNGWLQLWHQPLIRWWVPLILAVVSILGLFHIRYDDDIRQLQALPQQLKQQEATIKAITGVSSGQQMLLVKAKTAQDLLIKLAAVDQQLNELVTTHKLDSYQSIGHYLPSIATQKHNFELVEQLYQQQGSVLDKKIKLSHPPQFTATFQPLTIAEYLASPVSKPLRFTWLGNIQTTPSSVYGAVILLSGVNQLSAIKQLAAQDSQLSYLNKADEVSHLFGQYRQRVTELLIAATLVILALLVWRYRLKKGLQMIMPSLIGGCAGIAITAISGTPLNLFNLLALILILGIGIDYSLFFAELKPTDNNHHRRSTLLAITLSALTTVLSFGLLALSATQAIHSFGITVLTGIIIAWLLAPLAMTPSSLDISSATSNSTSNKGVK